MTPVFVSIGSNVKPRRMVPLAIDALRDEFGALVCSPTYRSAAVGFEGGEFLNLVCRFDTTLPAREVNAVLHRIEDAHGRDRDAARFSDRTLDLDLLLYGDLCLHEPGLQLPREEITRFAFVLRPLADLAGELRHPLLGTRYAELWAAFDDSGQQLTRFEGSRDQEKTRHQ